MPANQIPTPTVTVVPGADLNATAQAQPSNAVIGLRAPGTYSGQHIFPKSGQTFVGLGPGVILDGGLNPSVPCAFDSNGGISGVTIANMTITKYSCGQGTGYRLSSGATSISAVNINPGAAYGASPPHPATPDSGWVVNYCDLTYNRTEGIKYTDGCQVLNSRTNYNGVAGYVSSSANTLMDNCESAYNNTPASFLVTGNTGSDQGNHSGGGKVTGGPSNTCTHCWHHHNGGNNIWDDAYAGITVQFCLSEYSTRNGIMHEIGYAGVITDNLIRNAGQSFTDPSGAFVQGLNGSGAGEAFDQGAGIFWSDSAGQAPNNVIQRNTLVGCLNQIMLIQVNRFPYLSNVVVGGSAANANSITGGAGGQGHTGWEHFSGPSVGVLSFDYNTYVAAGNSMLWMWNGNNGLTFAGFQAQGQEAHGTSS